MTRQWTAQPIGGALMAFALVLAVAACGGGSTNTTAATTTTPTTVAGRGAAIAAFRTCMQSHGVALPAGAVLGFGLNGGGRRNGGTGGTGGTGGNGSTDSLPAVAPTTTIPAGVTTQQWQAAIAACSSQLPGRGGFQNNPQFQLYYNCLQTYLSTHGSTTLPPLNQGGGAGLFGGGGPGGGGPNGTADGSTTTTNPALDAARAHCAALRPALGRGSTTTSTTAHG